MISVLYCMQMFKKFYACNFFNVTRNRLVGKFLNKTKKYAALTAQNLSHKKNTINPIKIIINRMIPIKMIVLLYSIIYKVYAFNSPWTIKSRNKIDFKNKFCNDERSHWFFHKIIIKICMFWINTVHAMITTISHWILSYKWKVRRFFFLEYPMLGKTLYD